MKSVPHSGKNARDKKSILGKTPSALRSLREARGEDYEDIARIAGVKSGSAVRKWENGERFPGLHQAVLLADHFRVSLDELAGRIPLGQNAALVAKLDLKALREALTEFTTASETGGQQAKKALKAIDSFLGVQKTTKKKA